jgi:ornithine carbamoyltransferase
MVEIKVKQEYSTLDKTDFAKVYDLVDRIITDVWTTSKLEKNPKWQDELKMAMIKDYMIDLINPDLLDFNSKNETL